MLSNSFIHIPGIGTITERRFWESEIHTWNDFTVDCSIRLSQSKKDTIARYLQESQMHLNSGNPRYFSDLLPANQHWRLLPDFRHSTVYLDIETTGLNMWGAEITTIALYNGKSIFYYVNDKNLDDFLDEIKKYEVIVTYNVHSAP